MSLLENACELEGQHGAHAVPEEDERCIEQRLEGVGYASRDLAEAARERSTPEDVGRAPLSRCVGRQLNTEHLHRGRDSTRQQPKGRGPAPRVCAIEQPSGGRSTTSRFGLAGERELLP